MNTPPMPARPQPLPLPLPLPHGPGGLNEGLHALAPGLQAQTYTEAQVLGSVVWLWMHSPSHRDFPLHTLPTLLLPAIKTQQFVLFSQQGLPVGYVSWAMFHEEAERHYLANSPLCMPQAHWQCGPRMWILDWLAPFGHTASIAQLLKHDLFAQRWMRTLYHRGDERGLKVKTFRGADVPRAWAQQWFASNSVVWP